jgi:hypothetical protein
LSNAILCPYCNRKFSEKAGSRHIAYCKEKAELQKFKEGTPKTKIPKPTATPGSELPQSQAKEMKRVNSHSQQKVLKFKPREVTRGLLSPQSDAI